MNTVTLTADELARWERGERQWIVAGDHCALCSFHDQHPAHHAPVRWRDAVPLATLCIERCSCCKGDPDFDCDPFCGPFETIPFATVSVEVLPVVGPHFQRNEVQRFVIVSSGVARLRDRAQFRGVELAIDPLPTPGRDFLVVFTEVEP